MKQRGRVAAVSAAVMVSTGLALAGAPTAMAAPAHTRGSVGVQSLNWQGPYGTEQQCVTIQNEFRRYYTILVWCKYVSSSGYYFAYDRP